ncbi:MAG: hypothetical protein JWR51_4456 [Devosia sp.]|uniref:hypothetical protein n=1 Tax=Devosia sp. TaxID=1871048 RepID=UPI0026352F71|nr:hypothetical protein [Devosia sp.]MDB5531353.1 hypothetical protein [Devosia sp.]
MPPPTFTSQDLRSLDKLRGQETKVQNKVVATEVKLSEQQDKLDALVRAGAADTKVRELQDKIEELANGRDTLRDQLVDIRDRVGELHERVPDPRIEAMIPNFQADTPVLLLPVRLETRYFDNGRELRIRVFPDQIHIDNHETELTNDEVVAGQFYWQARWGAANSEAEIEAGKAAFAELARRFRPRRAAWIAYAMTPTNFAPPPRQAALSFPDPVRRASVWSRAAYATLLPTRWVAIGYLDGGRGGLTPAFTKSGGIVADRINTGIDPRAEATPPVDADGIATELPLDEGLKWLADFGVAEAAGMAMRVATGDLEPTLRNAGRTLASIPLTRLVVYGTNATLTGEAAAARLEAVLAAHVYSDGLELLTPGTPTNNSEANASGLDTSDPVAVAAIDPMRTAPAQTPGLDTLRRALGVNTAAGQLDRIVGVDGAEQVTAGHMINALWSATLGQTLDQLFDPAMSDADIGQLRDHAVAHLFPGGALPALRVGNQPYGILTVTPLSIFKPQDKVETKLVQAIGAVSGIWTRASENAPHIQRAGKTLAENMEALLQQGPMAASNSFRRVYGPINTKNANIDPALSATQERTRSWILGALGLSTKLRISGMTAEARTHRLGAPFVQASLGEAGAPLQPNYLADIALEAARTDGRTALTARGNASTLLETLASHAAVYELDRAAASVVHKDRAERDGIALPARLALRIDEMVAVDPPRVQDTQGRAVRQVLIQSSADMERVVLPERTGTKSVVNYVIGQLFDLHGRDRADVARYQSVIDSLKYLSGRPASELDRAMRGTLDVYSYRLDAWIASLANRRLASWRAKPTSKGVHIGGYGWVENLKPDQRPDSEGYIHAPSLQQAQAAAVLRAGHLAHRDAAGAALAIDLSSRRVRFALNLLRGVAQGQPLTALLGYRIERRLREKNIQLAKFILPLRRLFPLNPPAGDSVLTAQEAIAARDVVDAVKLLERRRAGGNWMQGLTPAPSAGEKTGIESVVAEIDDMFDAVADLLVAEGVYQLVGGNLERASAALGSMDRQNRPVEPEVVRTPRSGRAFAQRAGVLLSTQDPGADWAGFPTDSRAVAEPFINAWIARLLGNPKQWGFAANLVVPGDGVRPLDPVRLIDFDWSPIALAILSEPGSNERPSGLQQKLAALFAGQVSVAERNANAELHLLPHPAAGAKNGLSALEALMARVRTVINRHRPANALDIAPPGTEAPSGADPALVERRADKVATAQASARAAIEQALGAARPNASALAKALERANAAGAREAIVATDSVEGLAEQARQVAAVLSQAEARCTALANDFNAVLATDDDKVEHHVRRLKAMLGEGFPVLPPFALPTALRNEAMASFANADALLGKGGAPLHGWMSRMAEVRPRLGELAGCLIASEIAGAGLPDLKVAQFPHQPGARWIGLTLDKTSPAHIDLSLVVHAPDLDPANPPALIAGLMSDDWTEVIPAAKETTAISFHYDAPAARPPQALLLAVHPDPAAGGWLPSQLLATVNEAMDLARIRSVRPQDLDMMGALLPLVYLPNSYTRDVPSVDFSKLRLKVEASLSPHLATVMGKA